MDQNIDTAGPEPDPSCATWEDVDVDDGEGVCVDVDDDIYAEQRHAELRAELFDERGHGLGAGRREGGHLFIQLGGEVGKWHHVRPLRPSYVRCRMLLSRSSTYRRQMGGGLWLGHLMAVEENGLSVCRRSELDENRRTRDSRGPNPSESTLTAGPRGEVFQRGPFHAEVSVSHHKHFVQNGSVVDEALQHAGRTDGGQAAGAEDQGHLRGRHTGTLKRGRTPTGAQGSPAHLVGQRAVRHPGLTNWGQRRKRERSESCHFSRKQNDDELQERENQHADRAFALLHLLYV